jgi:hypothetical protein
MEVMRWNFPGVHPHFLFKSSLRDVLLLISSPPNSPPLLLLLMVKVVIEELEAINIGSIDAFAEWCELDGVVLTVSTSVAEFVPSEMCSEEDESD